LKKALVLSRQKFATRFSVVRKLRATLNSDNEGSALVEMGIALPVILVLMTGIFSFSIALYQKLQLAESVSNAGRMIAVDRGDSDPCQTATSAIYAAAPGLSKSNISVTYVLGGVNYGAGVTSCPGSSGAANANMTAGGSAQIIATYPCSLQVYGVKYASCNMASQITEVVQ
jgi:Flp pilus assembly protein TadG